MTALNNLVGRLIPLFYTQDTIVVTITSPFSLQVITTAAPRIIWTFSPGTQQSYVVQIFSDASATNLVYTSGIVNSANLYHDVTLGALLNLTTYYVTVGIFTTDGISGQSDLVQFSTSFAPSSNVTNVRLRVSDACVDPLDVPYVEIRWNQVVPSGAETFVDYRILRREGGETTWTTIATVTAVGTLLYRDYLPRPYAVYQYAVLWSAQSGINSLLSVVQTSLPVAQVKFDYGWIQPVSDPGSDFLRVDAMSCEIDAIQDVVFANTAGRQRPTAFVGEPLYHTVRVPMVEKGSENRYWTDFLASVESQAMGAVYCLRLGRQRLRYFGVISSVHRTSGQKAYGVSFTFNEVHYQEDVTL